MKHSTFGKRLSEVRKEQKISQDELGAMVKAHGVVIGRYERDEVKPSIEMAATLAEALDVSLDYLVGNTDLYLDKAMVQRVIDMQKLGKDDRSHLMALMDAFLRDNKTKKMYAH